MKFFVASTALAFLGLSGFSTAAYSLTDNYVASNFFSQFNFFTGDDPTHGFVNYIDQGSAQSQGLINTNNNKVYIGVDHTTFNPGGRGRNSIRLETKKQFTHGLFLLDLNHMPASVCGSWPAFWSYGPNWPNSGEIDILEGVNSQSTNFVTLHTGGVCKATSGGFSGQLTSTDCAISTGGTAGCSIHASNTNSYGTDLNNVGGGVYAMEWTSNGIKIWFFARNAGIPGDISSGQPNPGSWGTPQASFPGNNCDIDANFKNHFIVFDNTFCGDWAGASDVWNNDATCRSKASTCQAYVAGNPGAFQQSYWDINSLKIYQASGTMSVPSDTNSVEVDQPVASAQPVSSSLPIVSSPPIASPEPIASPQPIASSQPIASFETFASSQPFTTAQPAPGAVPTSSHEDGRGRGQNSWSYNGSGRNGGSDGGQGGRGGRNGRSGRGGQAPAAYRQDHQRRHAHARGAHGHRREKFF